MSTRARASVYRYTPRCYVRGCMCAVTYLCVCVGPQACARARKCGRVYICVVGKTLRWLPSWSAPPARLVPLARPASSSGILSLRLQGQDLLKVLIYISKGFLGKVSIVQLMSVGLCQTGSTFPNLGFSKRPYVCDLTVEERMQWVRAVKQRGGYTETLGKGAAGVPPANVLNVSRKGVH